MFFLYHHADPKKTADKDALVPLHEREHNTSEGGEFLDDAIRMDDEPSTNDNASSGE
ncbi:MAG: hypothetical protein J7623_08020 [Chitinophaga sp.]|uniref:hypothetical protein n=1 Tax=Chitinophaga sp. TaxID=1869181 RepID=UPI001B06EC74|nr:hypothetical protein [Chitinophaga sp.]MBO9728567.1 hypothetical protein [Chitinophaga sp.]